jgi:uncharacterized protein YndB with AHSA1/START domain
MFSMNSEPIIKEQLLGAPAERVWKALTDNNEMKKWYFDIVQFEPRVGFEFTFEGRSDEKIYIHLCKIREVIPGKKLSHSWRYEGYPGLSNLTFELFPEGDKTRLKLTHDGLETFPQDNPDFARESFVGGWNHIIGKSLPEYLAKEGE